MYSCTIIISHYDSEKFLNCCLRQIRKHTNHLVRQEICIIDQTEGAHNLQFESDVFNPDDKIKIIHTDPLYSGFGIDYFLRREKIDTEYICQLHCDCFPVSDQYLYAPIKLIEEYEFSFVGQLQFVSDGTHSIYPPEPFCAIAQCYNVAKTETYKELSLNAGFTRFHNRKDPLVTHLSNDWAEWAKHDYDKRGSDDDVVAFHWQDKYTIANKLGLSITGMIGLPEGGSAWGRVIDDLVFHFGSANEARGVIDKMPKQYQMFTELINKNGFDDLLLQGLLSQVQPYKSDRTFWDGTSKVASKANEDLNNRIEQLKNQ